MSRCFVSCFNVSPEFASTFKFKKSKGQGEFGIKYMLATFCKEDGTGEFFLEFDEYVWEHKLVESFQSHGAGQVTTITFANNDGGESATNALVSVMASQKKHGDGYTRGTCPEKLYKKAYDKMEAANKQELLGAKEFDEKTAAAIKFSLETHAVKLEAIEDGVQAHAVKLEAIEDGVQAQTVDLVDIKHGVCNVIPDYQQEIKQLKEALVHKTKLCDRIEGQKGRLTMEINRLKWELSERMDENEALSKEKHATGKKIQGLQMQLDLCQSIALLKQMQEETQRTAEILSSTLAEEWEAKRRRV
jgi:hypothetical protein